MVQWSVESLLQHITDSDCTIQGQKSNSKSIRKMSSLHTGAGDDVSFCSPEEFRDALYFTIKYWCDALKKVWRGWHIQIARKDSY